RTEAAADAAPFPDFRYKAGVRAFSQRFPTEPSSDGAALGRQARTWWRTLWKGPTFLAVGPRDPIMGPPAMEYLRSVIRDAPEPVKYPAGGHFLQEWGD